MELIKITAAVLSVVITASGTVFAAPATKTDETDSTIRHIEIIELAYEVSNPATEVKKSR